MEETLLVIEDDSAIQHVLQLMLEAEGFRVKLARNGKSALELLTSLKPALILLDLGLPDIGGEVVVAELERRNLRPNVPLLILTASYADPEDRQAIAARTGAESCVTKPFAADFLLAEINRLLGRGNGKASAQRPVPMGEG